MWADIRLTHFLSSFDLNVEGVASELVPPMREGIPEKFRFRSIDG